MPEDQTPVGASLITAVLHVILLAAFYVLFTGGIVLPTTFFVALFFAALGISSGVFYLTNKRLGAILLYTPSLIAVMVLVIAFFGDILSYAPTLSELGLLVLLLGASGALSSWIATLVGKQLGAGFLTVFDEELRRRRRALRE